MNPVRDIITSLCGLNMQTVYHFLRIGGLNLKSLTG